MQQAVDSITNCKLKSEIEGSFFDLSLKSMYSYQGLLSKYLYGFSNTDIQNKLFQLENIRREKFEDEDRRKSEIRSEKEILEKENAELSMRLDSLNSAYMDLLEMIPNEMSSIAEDFLSKAQEKIAPIADELESNKSQIEKDEEFLKLKKNIEKEKKNVAEKLRKNNLKVKEIIQSFGSLDKRKSLTENKPSIIYVDDHANDGWAFVYQRIIYGDKCDKFTIIQPDENTSVEKITENICNSIKEKEERQEDVELIILDLRLQKNEIGNIDPSKISGIQVLQNLQQRNLSCPILITTASNKLWSYKNVIAFGADAFWIKEGVDTNNTIENTVENYLNFIGLVHMLCLSEEYELLSFFRKNLCKLKNKNGLWWEKRFWKDDIQYEKEEIPSRTKVIRMLEDACQIFRNYLILKIQFSHNSNIQDNMAAIFIIQAFQAIEYIHKYDNNNETRIADKIKSQIGELEYNNSKCRNILRFRNDSAHDFYIEHKLKDFIYCLFEYLEESPVASSIKVIGTIEITNSPTKSSTTYATKAKIEKEDIQESKIYISSIAQQNENKSYLFLIENPNLNLEGRRYIMLDCRKNNLDENTISIGTKMQFKIKVVNNGHSKAYYAEDVMIVS
ncbi:hypothetical protein LJB85_02435 [Porphyromonadaceae bacterium OttesenSCG-928-L07]|nr:hypothetical protein [Porphyromonadaceae bacterium OttesenSCG-928-L07]